MRRKIRDWYEMYDLNYVFSLACLFGLNVPFLGTWWYLDKLPHINRKAIAAPDASCSVNEHFARTSYNPKATNEDLGQCLRSTYPLPNICRRFCYARTLFYLDFLTWKVGLPVAWEARMEVFPIFLSCSHKFSISSLFAISLSLSPGYLSIGGAGCDSPSLASSHPVASLAVSFVVYSRLKPDLPPPLPPPPPRRMDNAEVKLF